MYPNQQPPQQPQPPQTPPQQVSGGYYGPQPAPTYAVDYLEQIAPPPPPAKFLSGSFGKVIIGLAVVFVLAIGLIAASGGGKSRTADLENVSVRLNNFQLITKSTHKNLKNGKLLATNSNYQIWVASSKRETDDLLSQAGIEKAKISKEIAASEKDLSDKLTEKFKDAKLNANLDRVYAREMAYQSQLLITEYTTMSKTSQAKAIREYAKKSVDNLSPIQKSFAEFNDVAS